MSFGGNGDRSVTTITYRELFFYLYFAVMFGMRMWGVYEGTRLYGPLLILGLGFWGISVLMTKHTVLEYAVMAVLLAVAGAAYINSGEKGLILYFTLMLGMKGIDVKRLFKVGIAVGGAGMVCMTFLASFGIIEDVVYIQPRPIVGTVFRRALGMPHPNTLSTSFIILTVMIMYLVGHEDRRKVLKISVLLSVIAAYLYLYSGSRTGIVINIGFLAINLFYTYRKKIGLIEKIAAILLFPVVWGISIVLPLVASDELILRLMEIDFTLMSRIAHAKTNLLYNPVTLFGTRVVNPESEYGIDFAQLYLLTNFGIVAFAIVTLLYLFLVAYEIRENRIKEFIITVLFLLMGMTDPFLYNLSYKNICFVFIGVMVYKYMEALAARLPGLLSADLQIVKAGYSELKIKTHVVSDAKKDNVRTSKSRTGLFIIGALVIAAVAAIAVYFATPEPEYALTDRNSGEHRVIKDLEGNTYTEQEIRDIQKQGNIVLNYTDENELMYVYYSDENRPVKGGRYAQNAAWMEKVRKSISIFFWGAVLLIGIPSAIRYRRNVIGNNGEQGRL